MGNQNNYAVGRWDKSYSARKLRGGVYKCITAICITFVITQSAYGAQDNVDLDQAIRTALQQNRAIKSAWHEVKLRKGVINEQNANYSPVITAQGTDTHYDKESKADFFGNTIVLSKQDQRTLTIGAALPLDISGLIHTAVSLAKLQELSSELALAATYNDVIAQVKSQYYDVQRKQNLVKTAADDKQNADQRLQVTEQAVKAGITPKFDLMRAQTAAKSAEQLLLYYQRDADLALARLRLTMGLPQSAPLSVVDIDPVEIDNTVQTDSPSPQKRPEELQAAVNIRAAELGVRLARRSYQPSLAISAGYQRNLDSAGFGSSANSGEIMATLTAPIWDGGVADARAKQAKEGVELAKIGRDDAVEQIAYETQQATVNLKNALARIPVAETALTEAQESYRLASIRFKEGVSPQVEVTDAQAALTRAQVDYINARWDLADARNAYQHAIGTYAYRVNNAALTSHRR